jgi:MEMO1 family protein
MAEPNTPGVVMDREPVVAGQFYPGSLANWEPKVRQLLSGKERAEKHTILAMVPHAGYVYSGAVAGRTLAMARLAPTVVLLGPNHTGRGAQIAVWPDGCWKIPGAELCVENELALGILREVPDASKDYEAHRSEHSLEVMVPFLWAIDPHMNIVPVCIAESRLESLRAAGEGLARAIKELPGPVSIVVSSDMSHYISRDQAKIRDSMALDAVLGLDPAGLHETVRTRGISMCGVLPMTAGLFAARILGATAAELAGYSTSGEVTGDFDQVVGYAGVIVS